MEIPLMGRKIKLKPVRKEELRTLAHSMTDEDILGFYEATEGIIYIDQDLNDALFKRVLLHELMHAAFSISGLQHLLKKKLEESICDLVENLSHLLALKEEDHANLRV